MKLKLTLSALLACLVLNLPLAASHAADTKDIGSVTVFADKHLAVALSELASLYARKTMVTVSNSFGISENQKKRIEDGEAADLFVTDNPQLVQDLKIKGLVDVNSIGRLASLHELHFTAAVVAGENMTSARAFLAYLKSPEGHAILRKNGLSIP